MNLNERKALVAAAFEQHFASQPTLWARAPGRVDLMGSHTDYNLGFVMTMSIDRDTWIAARPRPDRRVRIFSLDLQSGGSFSLDDIRPDPTTPWTDYIRGMAQVMQAAGHELQGFDGIVHSTVPFSAGLSSSAALEMAAGALFVRLSGRELDPVQLALLGQKAENEFIGVNCGILDQYSSALGRAGSAILLDCRDLSSHNVPIPADLQVVICDTRSKRELAGSEYGLRRTQCEEGVGILSQFLPGIEALRDVSLAQFEAHEQALPPDVAKRCRFIIEENQRVLDLAAALGNDDRSRIAGLAADSFAGACQLYEICIPEMQMMIEAMRSAPGLVAARQAGAGFGGCLMAFIEGAHHAAFAAHVERSYEAASGIRPNVYITRAAAGAGMLAG